MHSTLTALALLASTSFVAASPQWGNHPPPPPSPSESCWTSTTCTDSYPTHVNVVTNLITNTITKTNYDPSYITTQTPSPIVQTKLVTSSYETTSTYEVTKQVKVPYVTSRVITVPVHTFSLSNECETRTTELYPTTVLTLYPTSTTMVEFVITTSTPCETELYPVQTKLHTNIITRTVEKCWTTTGHTTVTPTGWGRK